MCECKTKSTWDINMEKNFQTPPWVCDLMVSLVDGSPKRILEPTPGKGNLVAAIRRKFPLAEISTVQTDFISYVPDIHFDCVIANPPFSPMSLGFFFLLRFFDFSTNVIALMPWFILINSKKRTRILKDRGLCQIIHLPRSVFPKSRVQTCIMKFVEGYKEDIQLRLVIQEPSVHH